MKKNFIYLSFLLIFAIVFNNFAVLAELVKKQTLPMAFSNEAEEVFEVEATMGEITISTPSGISTTLTEASRSTGKTFGDFFVDEKFETYMLGELNDKINPDITKDTIITDSDGVITVDMQEKLNSITSLTAYWEFFEDISGIGIFEGLTRVDLSFSSSNFGAIPEEIGNLINLKSLNLDNCQISTIPASIGNLTKLETLSLAYNNIEEIPDSIGNLINLKSLKLQYNKIKEVPNSLSSIPNLGVGSNSYFYLNDNRITKISDELLTKIKGENDGGDRLISGQSYENKIDTVGYTNFDYELAAFPIFEQIKVSEMEFPYEYKLYYSESPEIGILYDDYNRKAYINESLIEINPLLGFITDGNMVTTINGSNIEKPGYYYLALSTNINPQYKLKSCLYVQRFEVKDPSARYALSLNGGDIELKQGEEYIEEGYGAKKILYYLQGTNEGVILSEEDISDKVIITGLVDINTPGVYTITYTLYDENGAVIDSKTRNVTVKAVDLPIIPSAPVVPSPIVSNEPTGPDVVYPPSSEKPVASPSAEPSEPVIPSIEPSASVVPQSMSPSPSASNEPMGTDVIYPPTATEGPTVSENPIEQPWSFDEPIATETPIIIIPDNDLPFGYTVVPSETEEGVFIILDPDGVPMGYTEKSDGVITLDDVIPYGNPKTGDNTTAKLMILIVLSGLSFIFVKRKNKNIVR